MHSQEYIQNLALQLERAQNRLMYAGNDPVLKHRIEGDIGKIQQQLQAAGVGLTPNPQQGTHMYSQQQQQMHPQMQPQMQQMQQQYPQQMQPQQMQPQQMQPQQMQPQMQPQQAMYGQQQQRQPVYGQQQPMHGQQQSQSSMYPQRSPFEGSQSSHRPGPTTTTPPTASRYGRRHSTVTQPVPEEPVTAQPVTPEASAYKVASVAGLLPLPEARFAPLCDIGITVVTRVLGEYYDYTYKGTKTMPIFKVTTQPAEGADDSLTVVANLHNTRSERVGVLKVRCIEEHVDMVAESAVGITDLVFRVGDIDTLHSVLTASTLNELGSNLESAMIADNLAGGFTELDGILTDETNRVLKLIAGSEVTLDSFAKDIHDLTDHISAIEDVSSREQHLLALESVYSRYRWDDAFSSIVNILNDEDGRTIGTTVTTYSITERTCNVVVGSSILGASIDSGMRDGDAKSVNKLSYPSLHRLLEETRKGNIEFNDWSALTLHTERRNYRVYYNSLLSVYTII